jgi:hypothetical protein
MFRSIMFFIHLELSDVPELFGSGLSRVLLLTLALPWCCCFFGFSMRYLEMVGFPNS